MAGFVSAALLVYWVSVLACRGGGRAASVAAGVGRRSYDIYLLHVALVGHPLIFLMSRLQPGLAMTYLFFAMAPVVTYVVPIGIGELIRRVPLAAYFFLGLPMRRRTGAASRSE